MESKNNLTDCTDAMYLTKCDEPKYFFFFFSLTRAAGIVVKKTEFCWVAYHHHHHNGGQRKRAAEPVTGAHFFPVCVRCHHATTWCWGCWDAQAPAQTCSQWLDFEAGACWREACGQTLSEKNQHGNEVWGRCGQGKVLLHDALWQQVPSG